MGQTYEQQVKKLEKLKKAPGLDKKMVESIAKRIKNLSENKTVTK